MNDALSSSQASGTGRTALIVGGTGPTGLSLVNGLRERGFEVAILHRGTHENPAMPADIEHIHCDPHFLETLTPAVEGRRFDVVIATYGRIRVVAEAFKDRAGQFITVSGEPAYRGYYRPESNFPSGMPLPASESAQTVASEEEHRFSRLIVATEEAVHAAHPSATIFRYPYVYGPRQVLPREWSVVRRILDRRPFIILADGGGMLMTHGYIDNVAHAVMLAVDRPTIAAGKIYNCGDDRQFSLRQVVDIIGDELGHRLDIVNVPEAAAFPARGISLNMPQSHLLVDTHRIRAELGYRDVIDAETALRQTARWYVEHADEVAAGIERRLEDRFDYQAEDRLAVIYRDAARAAAQLDPGKKEIVHPYAHPRRAGAADHHDR